MWIPILNKPWVIWPRLSNPAQPTYLPCYETEHGATDPVEVAWRTDEGGDGVDGGAVQAVG